MSMNFSISNVSISNMDLTQFESIISSILELKSYILTMKDENNGVYPSSLISLHISYIQTMITELKSLISIISGKEDNVGNMTLDDVIIPRSILDDNLEVSFVDNERNNDVYDRKSSPSSSIYFTAEEDDFSVDSDNFTQNIFDELEHQEQRLNSEEVLVKELGGKTENEEEILLQLDLQKDEKIVDDDLQINSKEQNEIAFGSIEEEFMNNEINEDSKPSEKQIISKQNEKIMYTLRLGGVNNEITLNSEHDSSSSLVSSFSNDQRNVVKTPTLAVQIDKKDEYFESPPASPISPENSIDAITAALCAMKINKSCGNQSKSIEDFDELLNVDGLFDTSNGSKSKSKFSNTSLELNQSRSPLSTINKV